MLPPRIADASDLLRTIDRLAFDVAVTELVRRARADGAVEHDLRAELRCPEATCSFTVGAQEPGFHVHSPGHTDAAGLPFDVALNTVARVDPGSAASGTPTKSGPGSPAPTASAERTRNSH